MSSVRPRRALGLFFSFTAAHALAAAAAPPAGELFFQLPAFAQPLLSPNGQILQRTLRKAGVNFMMHQEALIQPTTATATAHNYEAAVEFLRAKL